MACSKYASEQYIIAKAGAMTPCLSRYAATPGEYEMLLASIDFESTGQFVVPVHGRPSDLIWAYAIVVVRFNPITRLARVVESRRRIIKIVRLEGETDEQLWERMGWEMRCLKEFYHRLNQKTGELDNLKGFEAMQKQATVNNSQELATLFNNDLHDIENEAAACNGVDKFGAPLNFQYVWCTMEYDTVCASVLLAMVGAFLMSRWRNGAYNGGGHYFHSFVCGKADTDIEHTTWEDTKDLCNAITAESRQMVFPNHNPINDAVNTCIRFFLAGLLERKVVPPTAPAAEVAAV